MQSRCPYLTVVVTLFTLFTLIIAASVQAQSFVFGSQGSGNGQFLFPTSVAVNASNIVVADFGNSRIQVFDTEGHFVTTFGSMGSSSGQFRNPYGVAVNDANIVVADQLNARIQIFDTLGNFVTAFGIQGTGNGQFSFPTGVAVNASTIVVADGGNDRIQVFDTLGHFLRAFGSSGTSNGQFDSPSGGAIDTAGNIYVADTRNHRIQVFPTVSVGATVSGTITLQSCVNPVQSLTFVFRPTDGSATLTRTATLSSTGAYNLPDIPRNSYNLWIKGAKWLAKVVPLDTSSGDVSGVTATLLAGDVNNDNVISTSDYLQLKAAFGSVPGDPNWNEGADVNCDGVISTADYLLLKQNFGQAGDP